MTSLLETRERNGELATHDTADLIDMVSIRREALSLVRQDRLNQNDVDDYCQSVALNVLQRCGSVTSKERYRWSLRWSHQDALREMRQTGMHPAELSEDATEDARIVEPTRAERQEAYRLELIERSQTFNRLTIRGYYALASLADDCPGWLLSLLPGVADVMDSLDRGPLGSLPADWHRVYPGPPAQSMEEMMDRRQNRRSEQSGPIEPR